MKKIKESNKNFAWLGFIMIGGCIVFKMSFSLYVFCLLPRCDTDILFGKNNNIRTLMVGTGIHTLREVMEWQASDDAYKTSLVPDYYLSSLGKLIPFIRKLPK